MELTTTANAHLTADDLQRFVKVEKLADWCPAIKVLSHDGERGTVRCLGDDYRVHREVIRDGVRFSLPGCSNALQWTLTVDDPASPGAVIVHCTLNRTGIAEAVRLETQRFVDAWKGGLEQAAEHLHKERARRIERPEAAPWFG